ncbi:MAG: nucleoside deaminase [Chitinispirillaceae bacterium]|nr:nucleoside deaminase [Chitinispirillaceae bacterium]
MEKTEVHAMPSPFPDIHISLPAWVGTWIEQQDTTDFENMEGRMRFVIGLAGENIRTGTGGPFGAAIFDGTTHNLLAPGVNLVLSSQCSVLHAEMVAIMIAQTILHTYDLGGGGLPPVELVTSTAPCAMCLGAIPWAGIARLVCGARDEDARALGFDEGAKVTDWTGALKKRGIETVVDVCRRDAVELLGSYKEAGGAIYNSKNG